MITRLTNTPGDDPGKVLRPLTGPLRFVMHGSRWIVESIRDHRFVAGMGPGDQAKDDARKLVTAWNQHDELVTHLKESRDRIASLTSGDRSLQQENIGLMVRLNYILAKCGVHD